MYTHAVPIRSRQVSFSLAVACPLVSFPSLACRFHVPTFQYQKRNIYFQLQVPTLAISKINFAPSPRLCVSSHAESHPRRAFRPWPSSDLRARLPYSAFRVSCLLLLQYLGFIDVVDLMTLIINKGIERTDPGFFKRMFTQDVTHQACCAQP